MQPNWFIALPVDPGTWFERRVGQPPPGVRRFAPEDLHITVAFLGPVDPAAAELAWELARWPGEPIAATLGEVVPMGNPRRPSAISALLDQGLGRACALIAELRDPLLAAAGAPPDTRPPKPHLTVARPTRRASPEVRRRAVAWAASLELRGVAVRLDRLALYTWSPDRSLRQFQIVAARPLGQPTAGSPQAR